MPTSNSAVPEPALSPCIVAAVTPLERELFLQDALPASAIADRIQFIDAPDLTEAGWPELLARLRPEVLITAWNTPPLPVDWLKRRDCPLRYVCHITGSVRQLVPRVFLELGGLVSNWGASISDQVAEHGLLLALGALRNQTAWATYIARPGETRHISELQTRTLFDRRIGLHGFGGVARSLIPLLRPFTQKIRAYSAGVPDDFIRKFGAEPATELTELFANSEVLFECESLIPATSGVVSAEVLAALPDQAVFVNIGRGGVVQEPALLDEARRGRLRIAVDVATDEPVTPDSPLVLARNILLSPHIGGPTRDRYSSCGHLALQNLQNYLNGLPLDAALDLAAYDRAT